MRQKYKVFLNDRFVLLTNKWPKKLIKSQDFLAVHSKEESVIKKSFSTFKENKSILKLYFIHTDIDELWKTFQSLFNIVVAGGGLVFNENNECLMIFRRDSWDLPKGKLEKGEKIKECAVREVEEECGITKVKLIEKITTTYHIYNENKESCLKPSHWYSMKVKGTPKLIPQTKEDIEKAVWLEMSEATELLKKAYPSIKEVFKAFKKMD